MADAYGRGVTRAEPTPRAPLAAWEARPDPAALKRVRDESLRRKWPLSVRDERVIRAMVAHGIDPERVAEAFEVGEERVRMLTAYRTVGNGKASRAGDGPGSRKHES